MDSPKYLPHDLDELGLELQDLSHDEAIDRFAAYLAHDQSLQKRAELVKHIRGCPICHDKLLFLELTIHLMAHEPAE